jgi:hypothetical protein
MFFKSAWTDSPGLLCASGDTQAALVTHILSQKQGKLDPGNAAFVDIRIVKDTCGVGRFVTAYSASL